MDKQQKIIYILGAGRNGTTLLDIILGNNNDVFSAGELARFIKRKGIPKDEDTHLEKAKFWKNFRDQLLNEMPEFDYNKEVYGYGREHHFKFYKMRFTKSSNFLKYKKFIKTFFSILKQKTINYKWIVDSSKYPLRGYYLNKFFNNDIFFIYIKRHPLAVVKSFQKQNIEQPSKSKIGAHLYIFLVSLLSKFVLSKISKDQQIIINYQELTNNPVHCLEQIELKSGIDLTNAKSMVLNKTPFKPGFLFDGNRLRKEKEIFIRSNSQNLANGLIDRIFFILHKIYWK